MRSEQIQIIAIDDDPTDLEMVSRSLKLETNVRLHTFGDLASGLQFAASHTVDLVLLDLSLPAIVGVEGLESFLKQTNFGTPVVVLTGNDDIETYRRVIAAGAQDCICKDGLRPAQLVRNIHNAVERQKLQNELRHAADSDALTGLPNRSALVKELTKRLGGDARQRDFSLLFLDIDDFKLVNDSHGHEAGDKFLVQFIQRLSGCLTDDDMLCRFGGDEFVILLSHASGREQIEAFVTGLQDSVSEPVSFDGMTIFAAMSIGVVSVTDEHNSSTELLRESDTAMFAAKSRGKSRYVWFDRVMRENAIDQLTFEKSLWEARDRGELELHYQPLVEIGTGRVMGFEALSRWRHEGTPVPPLKFIPVAERTGAIHAIGQWVLETACAQLKAWSELVPTISVSINASPVQLERESFVHAVIAAVERYDIHPHQLTIEVTESGAIKDFSSVIQMLEKLQSAGVRVSVDDFGTGHSSLSQLHRLPLNEVKIDRSFINDIAEQGSYSSLFVETIHMLASGIGLNLVAEGIENAEQQAILLDLGYVKGQGYFYSPPLSAEKATEFLTNQLRTSEAVIA